MRVPLSIAYEDIYRMVRNSNCYVHECWDEGEWFMEFKHTLSVQEFNRWSELENVVHGVSLVLDQSDSVKCALESKGNFTTKSLYRFITNRGVISRVAGYIFFPSEASPHSHYSTMEIQAFGSQIRHNSKRAFLRD